ncbi:MAG: TlpA disulfide reductase family protein [Mycobacterium sp.]
MTASVRWTLAVLAGIVVLIVALAISVRDDSPTPPGSAPSVQLEQDLAGPRQRAGLASCPTGRGPGPEKLRDVVVECASDGSDVDVARVLAGRAVVLNLWAYWCAPCAQELPALAEYQRRVGDAVTVVTVHQDENEAAALSRLAELGVRLPTLQDASRRIAAALRVPNVMPATVVLRSDGSVAKILPQAFTSVDDIAAATENALR